MSYSISARGADADAARAALLAKFDEQVVAPQPVHAKDRDQAFAAVDAFLALLAPNPNMDVSITMNGSLSWQAENEFTWVNFGVSAGHMQREAA